MEHRPKKHHVSVSGVLKYLGVSRSGYIAWQKRIPSDTQRRREYIKEKTGANEVDAISLKQDWTVIYMDYLDKHVEVVIHTVIHTGQTTN